MIEKKFIENQSEVQCKFLSLDLYQSETKQSKEIYIDPRTKQKWEKYEFEFEDQTNYGIGLRSFPYCSIEETIEIALTSEFPDEIAGASALLFELDRRGLEIREPLLNSIEVRKTEISMDRFETIYWRTEIYDKTNNRQTMGKKLEEIESDSMYYFETSERAKDLKEKITTANKS